MSCKNLLKKSVFIFLLIFAAAFFSGCASAKNNEGTDEAVAPELPAMFDDWQYKGFETDYPAWCEAVLLEKDIDEIAVFFPEIKGRESDLEILLSYGEDVDSCSHFLAEEDYTPEQAQLVAKTWVKVDPYYEDFVFPYISIKLYLKNLQEESL